MKMRTAVLWILAIFASAAYSKTFTDAVTGASITTPDSWIHDSKDSFGYVIRDPSAKEGIRIRIHQADANIKNPEDAVNKGL
jgi:hypothetical protein